MATPIRSKLTRVCIPSSARRLQQLQLQGRPSNAPPNQINQQNDIGIQTSIEERVRDQLKRYKIEDEVMRQNLRWDTRYYKIMEWSCYGVLSVSTAIVIACQVVVRNRNKDKGNLQAGLICDL